MLRSFKISVVFCVVCLGGVLSAEGVTWDVTSSFGIDNGNPNGVWSYGWRNGSNFELCTSAVDVIGPGWWGPLTYPNSDAFYPEVWYNDRGFAQYGAQNGQLSLHPGPNGEACLVRWTAPSGVDGPAIIEGQFLPGDSGVMQVGIFENGNWASPLWTATDSGSFNLSVPLTSGDTIDFGVYDGGFFAGNTPLQATITASVPEPSTFALLGVAALVLFAYAWRRQKQRA